MGFCASVIVLAWLAQIPPLSDLMLFESAEVVDEWRRESRRYQEYLEAHAYCQPPWRRSWFFHELARQEAIYRVLDKLDDAQMGQDLLGLEDRWIFGFPLLSKYDRCRVMTSRLHLDTLRDMIGPALYYSGWLPRPATPLNSSMPTLP